MWPVMADEVDDQALDVRAVLVLISHDHQVTVAQRAKLRPILVLLAVVEPQDLHQVLDLLVTHDLIAATKYRNTHHFTKLLDVLLWEDGGNDADCYEH